MLLYFRLAWRNIWRHRRRTIIIVSAMGLGLAFMMMYDGLIAGFNDSIYGNAVRVLGGNIQIHAAGYRLKIDSNPLMPLADDSAAVRLALANPNVATATRRIVTGGLASNRQGAFPLSIIGIEPEAEAPVSLIAKKVVAGNYLSSSDQDSILVGRGLADAMGLAVGDRLTLVGSDVHKQNRQRTMTVIGIYDIGLPTLEKQNVYISLSEAQELYGLPGQSTEVQVNLKKLGQESSVVAALTPMLPGYEVQSWDKNYPELAATLGTKNAVMNVFSVIILVIAGIGILNLLLMAVYERTREIGLLGALGLKPRQIAMLFILEGTLIGVVGVVAGIIGGLILNGSFGVVGMDFTQFAGVTEYAALISGRVYPTLGLNNLLWRALTVVIIATLAAYIPAREAARRERPRRFIMYDVPVRHTEDRLIPAPDLDKLTERIVGCAYTVSNTLGSGFVEKVYENAHAHEMRKDGLTVFQQHPIKVHYDDVLVGEFYADLLVEEIALIELKAVSALNDDHLAQALNYLRATGLPACLLINFGQSKLQVRRLHPSPSWKRPQLPVRNQ